MSPNAKADDEVRIEVIDRAEDIVEGFHAVAEAFGRQARDAIWTSLNPGWDDVVSEGGSGGGGRARCASRMVDRWRARTHDRDGNANTVFLKATVPDKEDPQNRIVVVGLAVWVQASFVEGRGEPPEDDLRRAADLDALHPGDEREQRFLAQCYRSLVRRRVEVVREKASSYSDSDSDSESDSDPPAVFVLDLCAVDPAYQRRGIASRLVRWGLEEAASGRRGGGRLEAITEASAMGRLAYERLGFRPVAEIEYEVDEEFRTRDTPSNLFMRTGGAPTTGGV